MGYDVERFAVPVVDEFLCPICDMVLENPIETPCQHLFCIKCIEDWHAIKPICPVDRQPLTLSDCKPPTRVIRILIGNLDIKCDMDGCGSIVKLENLENHRSACDYNLEIQVICDKGCNLKITRREYQQDDCLSHFEKKVNNQEMVDIERLMQFIRIGKTKTDKEISDLKAEKEILIDKILSLKTQLQDFECRRDPMCFLFFVGNKITGR